MSNKKQDLRCLVYSIILVCVYISFLVYGLALLEFSRKIPEGLRRSDVINILSNYRKKLPNHTHRYHDGGVNVERFNQPTSI